MDFKALPLQRLIEQFEKMPGIGRKTAQRLAFYILAIPKEEALEVADAIKEACEKIKKCSLCMNLTEEELCPICFSPERTRALSV